MPRPGQKIEALSEEDHARLKEQRTVVERYLSDDADNLRKYQTAAGKLGLLRALIEQHVFNASQTYELQCLGIALGDVLVQELGLEWKAVEDAHGRDPCVQFPGTTVVLFPLTMISKRVERGEEIDIFDLFNGIAAEVKRLKHEADRTDA